MITSYSLVRKDIRYSEYPSLRRHYTRIEGQKQKPFIGIALPFRLWDSNVYDYQKIGDVDYQPPDCESSWFTETVASAVHSPLNYAGNDMNRCYNRAYSKLFSLIGDSAEMGAALAEWRSTVDMVDNRTLAVLRRRREQAARLVETKTLRLIKAYRALRRGNFSAFQQQLGVKPLKKHQGKRWNKPKEASSLWLEYWFGWSPTLSDIQNALKIWDSPYPDATFVASSTMPVRVVPYKGISSYSAFSSVISGRYVVRLQCKVRVSNPNLYRANQLGLVNPAAVAWELVPFSFLLDWFVNVGEVISGYTSELGLQITEKQVVRFFRGDVEASYMGSLDNPMHLHGFKSKCKLAYMNRELGNFPTPNLTYTAPRISWTRGLTAISLLIGVFSHKLP